MKKLLANLLSYILKRPIFTNVGLTTDSSVKLKKVPEKPIVPVKSFMFFELYKELGIFEVEEIIHEKKQINYVVNHLKTQSRFIMPKKWFDFFFVKVENNIDQLNLFKENKHE